jgi:alkylation response protein AidB-like acyl-CoA dehydrogenase
MGMRATQSNDYSLENVFVPEAAVFHSYPVGHFDAIALKTVWGWAMPSFGSVYLGIAVGAMAYARDTAQKRRSEGDPAVQRLFGEMEVLLETARAVLYRHADEIASARLVEGVPVQDGMARAILTKYVATNNAVKIVDKALEVVGGAGYYKRSPLERMYRDVRAGVIMPYSNLAAMELFGKTSLEIEMAPAIPLERSGHQAEPAARSR